jgi:hypothetical protein
MAELQLAANLIESLEAIGINYGHLQIVYGDKELEV